MRARFPESLPVYVFRHPSDYDLTTQESGVTFSPRARRHIVYMVPAKGTGGVVAGWESSMDAPTSPRNTPVVFSRRTCRRSRVKLLQPTPMRFSVSRRLLRL